MKLDIYYQPAFLQLDAEIQKGQYEIFVAEEDSSIFIYPYIKLGFDKPFSSYYDLSSPYGYCGPYCNDESFFLKAENAFLAHAEQSHFVSEFVRYHYLYNTDKRFSIEIDNFYNRTIVLLDLHQNWDVIWKNQFSPTNRNLVRKLEKEAYQFEISNSTQSLEEFILMYNETMKNVNANAFYYFPRDYYYKLFDELTDTVFLAKIVREGVTYASALFFACNNIVTYYLSARNLQFSKIPAGNLLLTNTIKWSIDKKMKWFNLGGGITNRKEDELFMYKQKFSKTYSNFFIGNRIHHKEVYNTIVASWIAEHGQDAYNSKKKLLQFYR